MRIRKTTLAALCLAFVSVVAYSAAGDRFFSNPTSNKDVVIQVNKAGVTTDVMTLTGAAADVAIGAASATGTGFNLNGKGLRVHNPATALDSRANMLLTNAYAGAGGSALGGIAWLLPSNTAADKRAALITSDTEAGHTGSVIKSNLNFYTNNGAGVTPVGAVSGAGVWTLGASGNTGVGLNVNGKMTNAKGGMFKSNNGSSIATSGTVVIPNEGSSLLVGHLSVSSFETSNGNIRTLSTLSILIRLGAGSITVVHSVNGSGSAPFTVTVNGSNDIVITNNHTQPVTIFATFSGVEN